MFEWWIGPRSRRFQLSTVSSGETRRPQQNLEWLRSDGVGSVSSSVAAVEMHTDVVMEWARGRKEGGEGREEGRAAMTETTHVDESDLCRL